MEFTNAGVFYVERTEYVVKIRVYECVQECVFEYAYVRACLNRV